jgi:hypothetical protein
VSWLRLHVDTPDHPKVVDLPNDAARWAYVVVLCEAKRAVPPGGWASERHFRHCLGRQARYLDDLLAVGLLEREGDRIVVHDWRDYQTDPTAASRQRRRRVTAQSLDSHGDVTAQSRDSHGDVTASRARSESESESESERPPSPPPDEDYVEAFYRATGRAPTAPQRAVLWELYDRHSLAWLVEHLTGDDPFRAALDADSAWQAERRLAIRAEEAEARREKKRQAYLDKQALMRLSTEDTA